MDLKIHASRKPTILYVVSWIFFIVICIDAGSFIFNIFFTMLFDSDKVDYFGLFNLYKYNSWHFLGLLSLISGIKVMIACIFYLIIQVIWNKKLDILRPFNKEMRHFLLNVAYLSALIYLLKHFGVDLYMEWLAKQGVEMPDMSSLHIDGAGVWLLMGVILSVIADLFKKGIEFQSENEMTI